MAGTGPRHLPGPFLSMKLRATSHGVFIPDEVIGTIRSVHRHAVNIEIPYAALSRAGSGSASLPGVVCPSAPTPLLGAPLVISLVDGRFGMNGLSIQVREIPRWATSGARIRIRAGRITAFGNENGSVDFDRSPPFDGALSPSVVDRFDRDRACFLESLRDVLTGLGRPGGMLAFGLGVAGLTSHERRAERILQRWCVAGAHPAELPAVLASIVGLGPGATPAGDDFVCGALLACELAGVPVNASPIEQRLQATTAAGASLVWLAVRRSYPAYVVDALSADRPERIVNHGATSGTDTLAGIMWGLRSICERC
jgi:hypothetical protein